MVAYDYGVKQNIPRMLGRSAAATSPWAPAQTPASEVFALECRRRVPSPTAPGDPEPCDYAIAASGEFVRAAPPLFGICLGHQLLGLPAARRR